MADYRENQETETISELYRRVANLEAQLVSAQSIGNIYSPRINPIAYPTPVEGQHAIDPADDQHMWYSRNRWRKAGSIVLFIKVFSDLQTVTTGDGKFIFEVSRDMDGTNLVEIEIYVTTVSTSGLPTVQIRNITQAADMLTTKVSIDANEKNSKDAATQPVIDLNNDDVAWGNHIAIDVDVAGTGAMGLGVILTFRFP